ARAAHRVVGVDPRALEGRGPTRRRAETLRELLGPGRTVAEVMPPDGVRRIRHHGERRLHRDPESLVEIAGVAQAVAEGDEAVLAAGGVRQRSERQGESEQNRPSDGVQHGYALRVVTIVVSRDPPA